MRAEVIRGHLDFLLLAAVARDPAHGYRIVEELRRRSDGLFDLSEGTVYPALYRLERAGLLTSRWDPGDGRRRRVYRLTRKGRSALGEREREWQAFRRAVEAVALA